MKKSILILLLSAGVMLSCSKNRVKSVNKVPYSTVGKDISDHPDETDSQGASGPGTGGSYGSNSSGSASLKNKKNKQTNIKSEKKATKRK